MAEPGPEPGYAWRVLALCGAAVFLAAAAAGAALLAWNLAAAASRGSHCPELELGVNATVPPGDPTLEVQELQRQLAEAAQREEALARQLDQAKAVHRELEEALRACESRQSRLQTQLKTLKTEMEEAKAQGTQMGAENGALTEALARWEAAATEATRLLEEEQRRARAAEAEGGACAAREAALRERVKALEAEMDPQRRLPHPRPRSGSRHRPSPRPARAPAPPPLGAAGGRRGAPTGESAPSGTRAPARRTDTARSWGARFAVPALDEVPSPYASTLSFRPAARNGNKGDASSLPAHLELIPQTGNRFIETPSATLLTWDWSPL